VRGLGGHRTHESGPVRVRCGRSLRARGSIAREIRGFSAGAPLACALLIVVPPNAKRVSETRENTMIKLKVLALLGIAAGMAASSVAVDVQATTLAARSGHAGIPSDSGCFAGVWAGVSNTCATNPVARWWIMPVQFSPTAQSTFRASSNVTSPTASGKPRCRVVVSSANNGTVTVGNSVDIVGTDVLVLQVNATGSDSAHYECELSNGGGSLTQVRW
jgi:hypothetical protein